MRATPLRPAIYLLARLVTSLAFTLLMLVILVAFGALAGGIHLSAGMWTALTVRLLLGAIPFIALGFAIGYLAEPNAAVPITNIAFLILSFASGLFLPVQKLPDFIQHLAPYLPTNRLGQLVWDAVGAQTPDPLGSSILWLVGYGLLFAVVAVRAYGREQARSFA
jgi:ABC-2 type transport system permease protein